ncbi:LuxR C-terminal-related transcriptional regulator [Pseudonocardia tropica]|uniref:LuxR C-terminal-related transcriptional regulator n=1 Tax=Pseudonocardia tropica TaxID=681289 RepID=A0ABV1K211_9PSEU
MVHDLNPGPPATGRVPVPLTPILGRESELAAARDLMRAHRLVTVAGMGGCGKTRLAVELALPDPDAVFVDLAPLTDPGLVLPTVARSLGLREAGATPVTTTLLRHLDGRRALLLLDNLEHLLDAADPVADLLSRCPGVQVLATSRAPLRVPGERVLALAPLPVPRDERDTAAPSVRLFRDRVGATPDLDDPTVTAVCRALDGLPLAIELAAAQVGVLGATAVLERTRADSGPVLPRRGVPARHRSLDDTLTWSVGLLGERARRLYRRLSVFADSWTADAARAVCGQDGEDPLAALAEIVDQSLVECVHRGPSVRYRMLRPVREHAAALLDRAGEAEALRARHAVWCRALAARVGAVSSGHDEPSALDAAAAQLDDLRAALDRSPAADTAEGLRTAADLYYFWDMRGYLGEGTDRLTGLLDRPESHIDPGARQVALRALALLQTWRNEQDLARTALREAAELAERAGDEGGVAWCAGTLAISHFVVGDIDGAVGPAERGLALARRTGERMPLLRTTCGLGLLRWTEGRRAEAVALLEENAALVAPSWWGRAKATWFLGWFSYLGGDLDPAASRFRDAADAFERVGDSRSLPDCWDGLGCIAVERGEHDEALELFSRADSLRARGGSRRNPYLRPHCEQAERRAREARPGRVTPREREVAGLIAAGLTNRQIGHRLGISERTAERHAENLRAKLGVGTRAQIAAWAAAVPTRA